MAKKRDSSSEHTETTRPSRRGRKLSSPSQPPSSARAANIAPDTIERHQAERQLEADLAALTRMHDLSTKLLEAEGIGPLLQEIVDAAVAIVGAEWGTLQLIEGDSLRIAAHHGHQPAFLKFLASAENQASTCGAAMRRGQRVVVEDVERSPLFAGTASLKVLRDAGVRAVQSTPLLNRQGTLLGIFSTHWSTPHTPDEHDLWRIDLLARQAADLIERKRVESEKKKLVHDLGERIKELTATYKTMEIVQQPKPVPALLQEVVSLLPAAWQYPEVTAARIWFDGQEYRTSGYTSSAWAQSAGFSTYDARDGGIEIVYLEQRPEEAEGPFLAEERSLINSLARTLEEALNRRLSEEALKESEEKYRSLFESMTQLFVLCEIILDDAGRPYDYRYVEANPAVLKYLNLPREKVIGKTLREITSHIDPYLIEISGRVALTGEPAQIERFGVVAGRWVHLSFESPRKGYFTVLGTDITERKQVEAALRESEERFRSVLDKSRDVIYRLNLQTGRYEYISPSAEAVVGYSPEELKAQDVRTALAMIHPDDLPAMREAVAHLEEAGQAEQEYRQRAKSGDYRWISNRMSLTKDSAGRPLYRDGNIRDITERKRAEEALQESERRERERAEELATFLEAAPTPVIIVHDPNGTHMTGNRAADELLRHPHGAEISLSAPAETKPRHFKAVKDGRELHTDELPAQRAARGEQVRDFEFSLVFDDGTTRHLLGYGMPLRDEAGQPRGAVHVLVDITKRKQAEEALRELNATLESRVTERTTELVRRTRQLQKLTLELSMAEERERKRMAEILHEDLQQMLAGAKFHLSLMRSRARHEPSVAALGVQVDQMLKDAIEKSRGLSHELSPAVLHYGDFTQALGWLASHMQAKHGLVVDVDAHDSVRLQSEALTTFLFRAAQELLFNVVKHAKVRAARVRVRRMGRYVCLSVSDRGRGFAPEALQEIHGFGLLSLRERVELLGGRMKIRSAEGQGSRFLIVVPDGETAGTTSAFETKSPDRVEVTEPAAGSGNGRLRVLLADDHAIVRQGLVALLREEPTVEIVGEAANGREAISLTDELRPDVVIMDVSMPVIDGDEATRQIKMHLPKTRVIALSMYEEPERMETMYRAGAESYVLKTAPSDELLAAIRGKRT